jgi:hypothetical protein
MLACGFNRLTHVSHWTAAKSRSHTQQYVFRAGGYGVEDDELHMRSKLPEIGTQQRRRDMSQSARDPFPSPQARAGQVETRRNRLSLKYQRSIKVQLSSVPSLSV